MGKYVFKLPDVGEGIVEGEIVEWKVKKGETVAEDQPLVDLMTDKATVVIPSPVSGKVLSTTGKPGDMVPVGAELIVFDVEGKGGEPEPEATPEPEPAPEPAPADTPSGAVPDSAAPGEEPQRDAAGLLARWFKGGKRKAPEAADAAAGDDDAPAEEAEVDEPPKKERARKGDRVSRVGALARRRRRD